MISQMHNGVKRAARGTRLHALRWKTYRVFRNPTGLGAARNGRGA